MGHPGTPVKRASQTRGIEPKIVTNSVPADHIHIKPYDVGAPSDVHQMGWQEIMEILHNLDDSGMVDAANDFHHLSHSLRRIAYQIAQHGKELAESWKGGAADAALTHFEDLYQYTSSLSTQAKQTGNALAWLGNDVLPHYKNLESPKAAAPKNGAGSGGSGTSQATASGFSPAGQTAANEAAREYLRSLSGHIQAANNAMPTTITGIPAKKTTRKTPTTPARPPTQTPPPGGGSPPPTSGPVLVGSPPRGFPVHPPTASPTAPPGGTLQSTGPVGATTAPPVTGGVSGPSVAGGSGAGVGGSGLTMPVGLVPAASSTATGAAGSADPASAGEGGETGMMPMAPGGGSGSENKERWRRSEADEDDDLWSVPACGTEAVIE